MHATFRQQEARGGTLLFPDSLVWGWGWVASYNEIKQVGGQGVDIHGGMFQKSGTDGESVGGQNETEQVRNRSAYVLLIENHRDFFF